MDKNLAINVLDFWHKLEFFESVELNNLGSSEKGIIHYKISEILANPYCLPWLDRNQIRRAGANFYPENHYIFKLYLGVFNRDEMTRVANSFFQIDTEEYTERTNDKGVTCFATVAINYKGLIDSGSLAISTLPWALGCLQKNNALNAINFDRFEQSTKDLKDSLNTINKVADNIKSDYQIPPVFTTYELLEYLKCLGEWAGFTPENKLGTVIIQLLQYRPKKNEGVPYPQLTTINLQSALKELPEKLKANSFLYDNEEKYNEPSESHSDDEVVILNSFYFRDLEKAIRYIRNDTINSSLPLAQYLTENIDKKPDLLTTDGKIVISDSLSIDNTPLGRWPGDSTHTMSLMQQFAINTISTTLNNSGLYSINGPPGTGKTTMLRDLIANNIVKRAYIITTK